MNVAEPFEGSFDHFVNKSVRAVERGDPGDESLSDAKMAAFKGDEVAQLEEALRPAGFNDTFR